MSGQTKMIIITSDEDIIKQFFSNKNKNTHIIDLDNNNNLDYLAQLSGLNSSTDQVYKRALDSSDHNQSKPIKVQKKSNDMICKICGDNAVGYNYDVLSCASCKIFFRRNAYLDLEQIKCLAGENQCEVAHGTRRRCKRCRLDRCFSMGMRKDFIQSEEEKQQRKKRLEENRNITSTLEENRRTSIDHEDVSIFVPETINPNEMNDILSDPLSIEDWITIDNVRSSFVSFFEGETVQCMCVDMTDRVSALITWSQFLARVTLRFINFFRLIPEFEDLNFDDRFILIKFNILTLSAISKCFYYNPIRDCCSNGDNEEAVKHRQFFALCGAPSYIREIFVNLVLLLVEVTKQDPILLSLLSIILLFCRGLLINENEPLLKDLLAVNRAQSHYIRLLWSYLVSQSDEIQACKRFTQLTSTIFQMQLVADEFQSFFRMQYISSNTVDRMAPLMQSVLQIS